MHELIQWFIQYTAFTILLIVEINNKAHRKRCCNGQSGLDVSQICLLHRIVYLDEILCIEFVWNRIAIYGNKAAAAAAAARGTICDGILFKPEIYVIEINFFFLAEQREFNRASERKRGRERTTEQKKKPSKLNTQQRSVYYTIVKKLNKNSIGCCSCSASTVIKKKLNSLYVRVHKYLYDVILMMLFFSSLFSVLCCAIAEARVS